MAGGREPREPVRAEDESTVSDIRIGADGRVHVFGTSREILEALDAIGVRGDTVRLRLGLRDAAVIPVRSPVLTPVEPPR